MYKQSSMPPLNADVRCGKWQSLTFGRRSSPIKDLLTGSQEFLEKRITASCGSRITEKRITVQLHKQVENVVHQPDR